MKKLFLSLVALFTAINMNAQTAGETFMKPMFGVTLSNLTSTDDSKMRLGLAGGAEFGYCLSDNFAVTAGALVSMQGCNLDDNRFKDYSTTLSYVNIPVLANYYVIPGLAIKAGIQPGFLISHKTKYTDAVNGKEHEHTETDGLKKVDVSIPIGLSYEFSNFVIDARYNLGLTKIFDDGDAKNSVFMLTLGYKVPF